MITESYLTSFLIVLGSYQLIKFLYGVAWNLTKEILPSSSMQKRYAKEDSWAIVTGGTDGIGLGFCEVLAEKGWNVFIISRNEEKIKKVIERLQQTSTSKFLYHVADFKQCNSE